MIWFLIITFTLYSTPHPEAFIPYTVHLFFSVAQAADKQSEEAKPAETGGADFK